jgi:methylglyoxal/glyoxal reductase
MLSIVSFMQPEFMLRNGRVIPPIGLGTWRMQDGDETVAAIRHALELGYRHIDTATYYGNESSVGEAVRQSSIPREELFVTSKFWPSDFTEPDRAFDRSLERLGLEYVDLYLIHWPSDTMPRRVWQSLERQYEEKRACAVGVSNFSIADLERLDEYASLSPMVNQVECSPAVHDFELVEYCQRRGIIVQAYTPLGRGGLVYHKVVDRIAKETGKTPAQVLLRWALQHDTVPLPKSANPKRMAENLQIFDFSLSENHMAALDTL